MRIGNEIKEGKGWKEGKEGEGMEEELRIQRGKLGLLIEEIGKVVVGQEELINKLVIGLMTGGHLLLEGVPGLAKTLLVKTIAEAINLSFKRIQFTSDLLPSDILGTLMYHQQSGQFSVRKGPIFSNIIIADEINRAPGKVQSALLESMEEKQVTIGNKTYDLDDLFWVLATENPIDQEGTYILPEAQLDRFMFKVDIDYPDQGEEKEIINKGIGLESLTVNKVLKKEEIMHLQRLVKMVYIDEKLLEYIVKIVNGTRYPEKYGISEGLISFGVSPRGSIYLTLASKAMAFLLGRNYVIPEDIQRMIFNVFRHRMILSYEAESKDIGVDDLIHELLRKIDVP